MDTTGFKVKVVPPFVAPDASPDEPLVLTWSDNDAVVTIRPLQSNLVLENTLFALTLTKTKDKAGNPLAGTFGWFKSGMVFFPTNPLPACSDINVVSGKDATDRAQNPLASPYNITFKTACN